MNNTIEQTEEQNHVITLQCAQDWFMVFQDQNDNHGFPKGSFPSALWIPYPDVKDIVEKIVPPDGQVISGIRIYFVIKPGLKEGQNVSAVLVPTTSPKNDPEFGNSSDYVTPVTLVHGAPVDKTCPGDNFVSIYDFIRPCPPYCDPESPVVKGAEQ
jgi:hypothetical protein